MSVVFGIIYTWLYCTPGAHNEKERPTQYICSIPTYDQNPLKFLSGKVHVWKSKPSPYSTTPSPYSTTVLCSLHEVKYPASIYGLFHLKKKVDFGHRLVYCVGRSFSLWAPVHAHVPSFVSASRCMALLSVRPSFVSASRCMALLSVMCLALSQHHTALLLIDTA